MISKNLSNIKQNSTVPAASAGQLVKTLLIVVLNTCATNLTFITEYVVKETCLYLILGRSCNLHSWSSKKMSFIWFHIKKRPPFHIKRVPFPDPELFKPLRAVLSRCDGLEMK